MDKYAIIVAGGSGSRMESDIPKQFLKLNGLPILYYTLKAFFDTFSDINLILVLPTYQQEYWNSLIQKHEIKIPHTIVSGGKERYDSVKNGLDLIPFSSNALVAIHDGVRPFVKPSTLRAVFAEAKIQGNCTVAVPAKDSLRQIKGERNKAVLRSEFVQIQTPQVFQADLIKEAFKVGYHISFTDDASVFEHSGNKIHLVEGSYDNIKLTTPDDLIFGEAILKARK